MNKPTQEEQAILWRWCGCRQDEIEPSTWICPDGTRYSRYDEMPETDMTFLFKYAVPKLDYLELLSNEAPSGDVFWNCRVRYHDSKVAVTQETPALALFKAIYEVIHEKATMA